jgi:hypothetical protein
MLPPGSGSAGAAGSVPGCSVLGTPSALQWDRNIQDQQIEEQDNDIQRQP